MHRSLLTLALVIFSLSTGWSQASNTQSIKGTILDKQSEMPLIGAAVELLDDAMQVVGGTITDLDGYYRLENVPIGRQIIRISYLGYEPQITGTSPLSWISATALPVDSSSLASAAAVILTFYTMKLTKATSSLLPMKMPLQIRSLA